MVTRAVRGLCVLLLAVATSTCSSTLAEPTATITALVLAPSDSFVSVAGSVTVRATSLDAAGRNVTDSLVRWTSSDTLLATASPSTGTSTKISGHGRSGVVTISALTPSNVTATVRITFAPVSALDVFAGDHQQGSVGTTLGNPLIVRATDQFGAPVTDAMVTYTRLTGAGSLGTTSVATSSNGVAASTYTLGTSPVQESVEARIVTAVGAAVTALFHLQAVPGKVKTLAIVSGGAQSAWAGTDLPAPIIARVTDAYDNPIPGLAISWSTTAGGTIFRSPAAVADSSGRTSVSITAGPQLGVVTATATASDQVATTTFTVIPGGPASVVKLLGDGQTATVGAALPISPGVVVLDAAQHPLPNIIVHWNPAVGGGRAATSATITDGAGYATAGSWTLGGYPGPNTLVAVAATVSTTFTATAVQGAATGLIVLQSNPAEIYVGDPNPGQIRVGLVNAFQFPVSTSGVALTATGIVAPSGRVITIPGVTDSTGQASFPIPIYIGPLGALSFTVTGAGLTPAGMRPAAIMAGPPSAVALVTQPPATALLGTAFAVQPVVQITDAGGNPLSVVGAIVSVSIASGGGTLGGTTSVLTSANGVATFTDLSISGAVGNRTLKFVSGALLGVRSSDIAVSAP